MKRIFRVGLIATALLASAQAHADLYGYVDESGRIHLSPTRVDDRYQLFQKSPPAGTTPTPADYLADATRPGLGATLSQDRAQQRAVAGLPAAKPRLVKAHVSQPYNKIIGKVAREYRLDPQLLHAIVSVESGYDALAVSPKGAIGLMQIIPETGERFGLPASELSNPHANVRTGARYLKFLLSTFNHNLPLVIAAYNAGEGAVQKYRNTIPPYPETRDYVARVLATYEARGGRAQPAAGGLIETGGSGRVHATLAPL